MNEFYDGKYDVLLATSIVESGLDIPTANTMIVHRADMFGLSQLYQIRGRVGRAKTRAYCYLTTKPRAPLTPQATKRLRLLGSLDSLGAGFNLASRMTLTCAARATLLGEEQSGHIKEVGYELYQQMLEETIAKIKSGELQGLSSVDDQWAPQINLGVPVMIPESYIPDLDIRLGLYRRLSVAGDQGGVGGVCGRVDRPLRAAAERGQHADADRADQGDVQDARAFRGWMSGPRARRCSFTTTSSPIRRGWWNSSRRRGPRPRSPATRSCWWAR